MWKEVFVLKQMKKFNIVRFLISAALGTSASVMVSGAVAGKWDIVAAVGVPFVLMIAAYAATWRVDFLALRREIANEVFDFLLAQAKKEDSKNDD